MNVELDYTHSLRNAIFAHNQFKIKNSKFKIIFYLPLCPPGFMMLRYGAGRGRLDSSEFLIELQEGNLDEYGTTVRTNVRHFGVEELIYK